MSTTLLLFMQIDRFAREPHAIDARFVRPDPKQIVKFARSADIADTDIAYRLRDDKYFDKYFSMNAQDRAKLEAEYKERDKDRARKTDALVKQIFAAEDDIKRCLLGVTW